MRSEAPGLSRRAALRLGVGLAGIALARRLPAAPTAVDAQNICIDLPIDEPPSASAAPTRTSPAEFSFQLSTGQLPANALAGNIRDEVAARATNLNTDFPPGAAEAAVKTYWEGRHKLMVHFLEGSQRLRLAVLEQANKWREAANIEFGLAERIGDSDLRVTFRPRQGHKSLVGTDAQGAPGRPTMNLDMNELSLNDYNLGVILHEFGHALGFVHEHQSPGAGGIQFKTAQELLPFFTPRGLGSVQLIEHNIIRRYQASELRKFSQFDPDSIMLYAFPPEVTRNNQGTKQNTVLSALDKQFCASFYGPANGPPPPPPNGKGRAETKTLTLGGEAIAGRLGAGAASEFALTIPASQGGKSVVILTEGATQVMLSLTAPDGKQVALSPGAQHGTYDLMNEVISLALPAGDYKVTAAHPSSAGGGAFRIQARDGKFDKPLAPPLKKL